MLQPADALAQSETPPPPPQSPPAQQTQTAETPVYRPPLRGAPGGRVGGASRNAIRTVTPLPEVDLLAPADHAGLTASSSPTLYFFVSRPVGWPTQFTISAPMQPAPVLEVTIPSPSARGLYALRLADYGVRLQPNIDYTWSVSIVMNPHAWSRNIVASASLAFDPAAAYRSLDTVPLPRRAAVLADAGLWYDAVAAAVEQQNLGQGAGLDALIAQARLSQMPTRQQ